MRRRLLAGTCLIAATAVLSTGPARAQEADAATYQPYGEIVAHAGDESGVSIEGWSPMIQGDTALLFVDGRIGVTDDTDGYTNLGIGVRAMLGESVVVGGYGYFDFTRDESDRQFYGATFGAEVMTPRFELRANYYMPTTGDKYLGTQIDPTGALTIAANELVERRDTMRFDLSAMDGADAEVGVRLFGSEDGSNDFRLYAGGYRYWDDVIDDVEGGYGEAEYRLHGLFGEGSFLSLAGRVSDDNLRGTDVSGQLRLRLSFGKPRGNAARLTGAESRMTERVRRRGPIMLQTRATPGTQDFGVLNNLTGQAFGQFFFVDGANTAGSGDPDDATTLGDAATRAGAGDTIVAQGGAGNITTTGITLADGASLVGGGGTTLQVRTENGGVVPFTLGTSAGTIANSNAAGDTIKLGDGNLLANLTLTGGANAIVGDGITGTTIRNVTISGVAQSGIALTDVAAASIADSTVTGGAAGAIAISGTGAASLSGLSLASSGGPVLSLDGTGGNLVIARFEDLTIAGGNGETAGVLVTDAVFDANPATTGIEAVSGGDIAIGSATDRVGGGGLVLDGVLGAVAFGDVDIYTDGGDGLYVRDGEGKAGSFFFANDSGTIDAIGGAAVDIDPVTVDSTFDSLVSTGSPGAGLIFDTVAGSFTVTGPSRITDPATHGIVIVNSTADFSFGATEITGFSGTGADLRGARGDVRFASLDIEGDGSAGSKGIDMSGSTNAGFVGTTGPSTIKGVETGVDLTGAQITGTFQFGDGSDTDGNGAASLIEADTPIVATDLGVTGTFNFLDAELVGDISGLAGDDITVFFVDSTAGTGTADDPGTIAQAEASGADIIVLVNDGLGSLDAAGSGSDNTLLLAAGQRLTGFFGQDSFDYVQGGPQANLLVHGMAAGVEVTVDDPTGNGAATLTSSLSDALTASGNAQVDHVIIGSAVDYGISINDNSGTIAISDSQVSSLLVSGGSSVVSLVNTDLTGGSSKVLNVTGGHTGSVALDSTSSITDSIDDGLLFDSAAGTYTIAAPVTLTGGMIQVLNSSGTIDFTGAVTITDTDDNYPAAVYLTGANGAISFGTVDIVNPLAGGIKIVGATDNVTFADASIGASTTPMAAVSITDQASTSTITFDTLDLTRTVDADANGFEVEDSAGTVTVTAGSFSKTGGSNDLINIYGGSATVTIGATLSDLGFGNGIDISGITGGAITFTGDYTKTGGGDATWIGFDAANTGGTIAFDGDVTVTDGANINIYDTHSIAFNGTTSVTGAVGSAVYVRGSNGTVSFVDLDIAMSVSNSTGLDLNGASFSGGFSAKDFDLTSATPINSIGVDLRGTSGTVRLGDTVASGGASASISGVLTTGVRIDNTSDVTFTFGDGENTVDVASVIDVTGTAIDFGDNDGTVGSFNFVDVDWTQATSSSSYANLLSDFTVYYIDAQGDGDGSALNPGSFGDGDALAADVLILVNQNASGADTIDLDNIAQGGIGSYEIQDGQGLFSFNGNEQLNLAQYGYSMGGAPTNFQFTAITSQTTLIDNPGAGAGAPLLTTTANLSTITVGAGSHVTFGGVVISSPSQSAVNVQAGAASVRVADSVFTGGISGLYADMASGGSGSTLDLQITGSSLSGTSRQGLYLRSSDTDIANVSIGDTSFSSANDDALRIETEYGGSATLALTDVTAASDTANGIWLGGALTITDFDGITVTAAGQYGLGIVGYSGDDPVFDADPLSSGIQTVDASQLQLGSSESPLAGSGLRIEQALGSLSIDDLQIHVTSGTALYIDGSNHNTDEFVFAVGTGDVGMTNGASNQDAMYLNYITTDITLDSFTAKLGQNGVNLNHVAGGGADGNALTIGTLTLDGMAGYGMLLQGVEGDVTVTDGAIGGTDDTESSGVGIFGGTGNFGIGADITKTSAGNIVNLNGGDPASVTFSGALSATGGFDNGIRVANLGSGAISFTGPVVLSTGASTAVSMTSNAAATISFSGGLDIDATDGYGINASGGGTFTIADSASISNTITTTGGRAISFDGVTIGDAGMTLDSVDVTNGKGGVYLYNLSQTSDSSGLAILDGSISVSQSGGYAVSMSQSSADVSIGADLASSGSADNSVNISSSGRTGGQTITFSGAIDDDTDGIFLSNNDQNGGLATITFSGAIDVDVNFGAAQGFLSSGGGNVVVSGPADIDVTGSVFAAAGIVLGDNTGSTITFSNGGDGLSVNAGDGTGLYFYGGGTLDVSAQTSVTTTSGTGVSVSGGTATFNAGGNGLDVVTGSGTGFSALQTTLTVLGGGNSLSTTSGQALALSDVTIGDDGAAFASITASAAGNLGATISLSTVDGGLLDIGAVSITGGSQGIRLGNVDADVAFGDVTLTGQTSSALSATGTINGAIGFDDLSIALTSATTSGVILSNAVLNGDFIVTDFDLTSTSATGTYGIQLNGTTGTGTVRFGDTDAAGESATIAGVGTGVTLSDASDINFIFGDGEGTIDVGSSISAVTAIDFTDASGANGTFNFLDVTFPTSGSIDNLESNADVYWIDAEGNGDGSKSNPGNFAGAAGHDVIVVANTNGTVQDIIDLASSAQGSVNSYTLTDGQLLLSFAAGDSLDLADYGFGSGGAPASLLLTNITNNSLLTNPFAGMAPELIGTGGGSNVINLADGSTTWIDGVRFGDTGNTFAAIGGSYYANFTLTNSTIRSGNVGILLALNNNSNAATSTLTIRDSVFTAAGTALSISAGFADAMSVTLDNVTATSTGGKALNLNVYDMGGATLAIDGLTLKSVDTNTIGMSAAGGDFVITAFKDITTTGGGLTVASDNGNFEIAFDADLDEAGLQAVDGGHLAIGVAGTPVTGSGLTLTNVAGELGFNDIDIYTDGGAGLTVDNSVLKAVQPSLEFTLTSTGGVINSANAAALYLDPLNTDLVFESVTSSDGYRGIYLEGVTGVGADGNALTIGTLTIDDAGYRAVDIIESTGAVTIENLLIDNTNADGTGLAVSHGTATGALALTVLDGSIITSVGRGAEISNSSGPGTVTLDVTLDSLSTTEPVDVGVFIGGSVNGAIDGTFDVAAGAISAYGKGVQLDQFSGSFSYGGTITSTTVGRTVEVSNSASSGTITFSGAIDENGTGINLQNNAGKTISFSGGLDIDSTTNAGFTATGGGTVSVTGTANTINTTTGRILNLSGVSAGTSGINFASLTSTGTVANHAIYIDDLDGSSFSGGTVSIAGTSGSGNNGIVTGGGSAATVDFGATTIFGTAGNGIVVGGANNGAVTFASVNINNTGTAGVWITDNTGAVNINGGSIGATNDPGGIGVSIAGGSGNIAIAASVTKTTGGKVVDIANRTGGSVTFSGDLSATGGFDNGIYVHNNNYYTANNFTGAITLSTGIYDAVVIRDNLATNTAFSGGIDIVTTDGRGVYGSSSNAISFTGSNSISTTHGRAIDLQNAIVDFAGMKFDEVDVADGSRGLNFFNVAQFGTNGIDILDGSIQVSGNGANGVRIVNSYADFNIGTDITATSTADHSVYVSGTGRTGTIQQIEFTGAIDDDAQGIFLENNVQAWASQITFSGAIDIDTNASATHGFYSADGGHVSVTGPIDIDVTGSTIGVGLYNNPGSTISFAPSGAGLDITTASGTGFEATGGGTISVTGSGNSIQTATGQIINLSGVSAGTGGINFASLASTGTVSGVGT